MSVQADPSSTDISMVISVPVEQRQQGSVNTTYTGEVLVFDRSTGTAQVMSKADIPALSKSEVEQTFRALAERWYLGTMLSSSYLDKILHPAYQKILTLDKAAVPLILRELQDMPNDWFWALRIITDADPTTPEQAGDMEAMAEAWLKWGKENKYIQ